MITLDFLAKMYAAEKIRRANYNNKNFPKNLSKIHCFLKCVGLNKKFYDLPQWFLVMFKP